MITDEVNGEMHKDNQIQFSENKNYSVASGIMEESSSSQPVTDGRYAKNFGAIAESSKMENPGTADVYSDFGECDIPLNEENASNDEFDEQHTVGNDGTHEADKNCRRNGYYEDGEPHHY